MLYKITEKIFEMEQAGHRIVKLNIGEPDWPTAPECVEAAIKAIKEGKTKYASVQGQKELRERLAQLHEATSENVVITPGSKYGINYVMKTLLKKGDEVILFSPHWTAFELIAKEYGAIPKGISLSFNDNWKLDFEKIEKTITKKTKLIIFNNPCNPTSHIWPMEEENRLIDLAKKKGVYILLDCAYRGIAFTKIPAHPAYQEHVIITDSFSKTFGMTGWRLGYVVANEKIVKELVRLGQISVTNVPVFIQEAGIAALDNYEKLAEKTRLISKKRADACIKVLRGNVEFTTPGAGFYLFPKLGMDGEKVFEEMLAKHKIALVPGKAFGNYKEFARLSLTYPESILEDACKKLVETIEKLR